MTDDSPTLLRRATNALEEIFFIFTPEGEILEWNERVNEETAYSDEEIGQMHPTDLVPAEDTELIREKIAVVLEEERVRFEARLRTKDGQEIPYEFTGSLIEHEGEVLICGTGRDITERKRAQEELKASERRYRRLFEDSQEGIAITTLEGDIVEANSAAEEIFGYSREELRSMNAGELYVNTEKREEAVDELQEKGAFRGKELRLRRRDGDEIVCEVSTTAWRGPEGEVKAFQGFFREVTQRKRAEEALKESEEMFRTLAEGALVGITLIQEGTYEYVNPALAQITGYSREDLLGASPKSLVHPEDWPYVRKQIERRLEEGAQEVHYEGRALTKSGETRYVEVSGSRITYQGEPALIATVQDVTERRKMQREMIRVQEEERRRIGQDLHDSVASQLTGANLKLNVLSSKVQIEEAKEDLREVQSIIQESAGDVRRLSRGLNPGGLSEGDLPSALKGLADNTDGARFENLSQAGSPKADRPEADRTEDESLLGDEEEGEASSTVTSSTEASSTLEGQMPTHLYRIAQEAVANAKRHGEADEVIVRLKRRDDALILEVEDDGKGFDPDQADTEGLGLRSMRHRAELLGANLTVDSAPGEGTLLRCSLLV